MAHKGKCRGFIDCNLRPPGFPKPQPPPLPPLPPFPGGGGAGGLPGLPGLPGFGGGSTTAGGIGFMNILIIAFVLIIGLQFYKTSKA